MLNRTPLLNHTRTSRFSLMQAVNRRWIRSRPGSVLILVIALLVLLALIGTAYLSSTQTERYTTNQNAINTEADLLVQGLVDTINSQVTNGLNQISGSSTQYRAPATLVPSASTITQAYHPYDNSYTDLFLADRMPVLVTAPSTTTPPYWDSVSWPPFLNSSNAYAFDSPTGGGATLATSTPTLSKLGLGKFYPTTITLPDGSVQPALSQGVPTNKPFFAADTDGDGIADAGLFKLPVGMLNGITYYGAYRVVDNNSAINVNTALSNVSDYSIAGSGAVDAMGSPGTAAPLGFFPSHVGLMQVMADYSSGNTDIQNAVRYLCNQETDTTNPLLDTALKWGDADPDATPGTARTDYGFLTIGDHLSSQVARRLGNPGYFATVASPNSPQHTPFGQSSLSALAYHYCLRNSASTSDVESQLYNSLYTSNRTTAFGAGDYFNWNNYLLTGSASGGQLARPILTTTNAVSDFIPEHYVTNAGVNQPLNPQMLPYTPSAFVNGHSYNAGDYVKFIDPGLANQPYRCYVALQSVTTAPIVYNAVTNTDTYDTANWRLEEAWTDTPVKAGINTADFPTLWRAFYNIMADTGDTVPPVPGGTTQIAYANAVGWGPFRNPVRALPTITLPGVVVSTGQVMQIRAALAAVNTMDMRSGDGDIASRTITLYTDSTNTAPQYTVTVFGLAKQPFITTVVADTDGVKPTAVSIEIYNPTDTAIDISNWQLGSINRGGPTSGSGQLTLTSVGTAIPAGTIIQANSYLVLQSTGATNFTAAASETAITIAGLEVTADPANPGEVVLLRPRHHDNTYNTSTVYDNQFAEGTVAAPHLDQLVPVDSIDFSGVFQTPAGGPPQPARRVYERPHGVVSDTVHYNWQFVYPGKYDPTAPTATTPAPAQGGWGTLIQPVPPTPPTGGAPSDGTSQGGLNPVKFQPIQLATSNWVGPNPENGLVANKFPYGAFARNGDMLKVPFIGAYVIRAYVGAAGTAIPVPGAVIAMNSITMDASQANASDTVPAGFQSACVQDEAIGRFCPLAAINPGQALYVNTPANPNQDPYGWASDFFDYLDVQAGSDDFMPNADPRLSDGSMVIGSNTVTAANPLKYVNDAGAVPSAVGNVTTNSANGNPEQALGKQGLININTASSYVLQQLPGVTAAIADEIVKDRIANGPYKTIFDLNRVGDASPEGTNNFQSHGGAISFTVTTGTGPTATTTNDTSLLHDPGLKEGDFTLNAAGTDDGVRNDFEEKTLMLNRISNLVTTRSDTFTCYVLLQGWRNVGTGNPTLAVQRRAAFLVDRNSVTATSHTPVNFKIPAN